MKTQKTIILATKSMSIREAIVLATSFAFYTFLFVQTVSLGYTVFSSFYLLSL